MPTVVEVLKKTEAFLAQRGVPQPRREAELLLGHVMGVDRVQVYLSFDKPLAEAELAAIRPLVTRRGRREPLGWILGSVGFHMLDDVLVHPGVLVPRPDTEALVEAVLACIPEGGEEPVFVADVGCGSGAAGLAVAVARPQVRLYALDLSDAALENTRANVEALGLDKRVGVLKSDLLQAIPEHRPIDWVISNPPYIARAVLDGLEPEVAAHEPRLALDGGPDGLDVYRRLIPAAAAKARRGVLVEIGHDQGEAVAALSRDAGLVEVTVRPDLGGRDRVVSGRVPA